MRKKSFLGALVAVVALAVAAVALASPQLTQTADVKLSSGKVGKSVGVNATLTTDDPGAEPQGNFPAVTKVVLKLPAGTRTNSNADQQCNLSSTDVQNNKCPANTIVGTGSILANVYLGGSDPAIQDVPGTVTAYNRRNGLAFRVVSQATTSLPSVTIPILATLTRTGVLTTNVPILHPAGPQSKVILTKFAVNIRKKSRFVGRGRRRHKINLVTSPRTCRGTWKTVSDFTYDDGSTRHVESTASCTKP